MVNKFYKFFGYSAFFILALMYFIPKVSLYYFLETKLNQFNIVISSEETIDKGFTLQINNPNIYYTSIQSANIKEINIQLFMLYNVVNLQDMTLSSTAKSFIPLHIENVTIKYTIFDPLYIKANIDGEFGKANVSFGILKKILHLELFPSELMSKSYMNTLKDMNKNKEGEFAYDKTISF